MPTESLGATSAEVLLADGRVLSTITDPASVQLCVSGDTVQLAFRNHSDRPVRVEQLRPLVAPSGYRDLPLEQLRIGGLGWQSWSRASPPAAFEPNFEIAGPPIRGPYLPHRGSNSQVETWMAILSAADAPSVLMGFARAKYQLGYVEITPTAGGHALVAATELEGASLAPGAELLSEPLLILTGSERKLLSRYRDAVAAEMRPRPMQDVLSGWCSWYQLYTSVSEADVRRNVANLSSQRDAVPLRLIQLDDGFQRAVGDWLELNDKFAQSLRGLASDIRAHGFTPGLWLAPFLLSANSHTYEQHPDWIIRDPDGNPLNALHNWGSANYCLDTTNPAALDWICHVIEVAVQEWGFDYLKLDFLYAAALRGVRHDSSLTSVQAYRAAMRRIREVAGERFILGCGAPLLPSIGTVDGMRIGSDVANYWGRDRNADGPALSNALRATLARGWLHGSWWANDPDCVVVRAHDTQLTQDEVQAWAAVVALSGGMLFVGDDVSQLEPDRLALLSRLVPPSGRAADVAPPLAERMPQRLHLRVAPDRSVVGIANWSDSTVPAVFEPSEFGLEISTAYHLFDQWSGAYLGCAAGPRPLPDLPTHSMHLLAVHPDQSNPRVVGSTGHLLGPAMDIASERWDAASRTLVVTPSGNGPRGRRGEIVIADGSGQQQRVPFATATPDPIRVACA